MRRWPREYAKNPQAWWHTTRQKIKESLNACESKSQNKNLCCWLRSDFDNAVQNGELLKLGRAAREKYVLLEAHRYFVGPNEGPDYWLQRIDRFRSRAVF